MSITLTQGLADQSKELGEATTNTSTRRIQHYNDAVQELANERKLSFLVKEDTSLSTGAGNVAIDITGITDMRMPGGVKEILISGETDPFLPVAYEDRLVQSSKNRFYITPDEQELKFTKDLEANKTITMLYWYIPARIEDTASEETFPIPARYRKAVGTLAAAFVQYSRYLDGPGSRLINFYNKLIEKIELNQSEIHSGTPRQFKNPMTWRGPLRGGRR